MPKTRATRPRGNQTQTATARAAERTPVPEYVSNVAPPLDGGTANDPAVPVVAPVVSREHVAGRAADGDAIGITPEERDALTTLISQAAMADGFKGRGYVRAWLQQHYQIDVSDVAEIPREIRARVRAHALSVLERREQETPRKPQAPTTRL